MATRAKFARLTSYSRKFGKASHIFLENWPLANVGEFGESAQYCLANVGESGEYLPSLLANVGASAHDKIGRFKHK